MTGCALRARIQRELAYLALEEVRDFARSDARPVHAFEPHRIVGVGSQARGAPNANSDADLVIVGNSDHLPSRQRRVGSVGAKALDRKMCSGA